MYVGGGGKFLSTFGEYAPRATDKVMEASMFSLQQRTDMPTPMGRADSLHEPSTDGRERGDYPGHVAESSLYTKASLHPMLTGALLFGAGLAVAALIPRIGRANGNGRVRVPATAPEDRGTAT